jgi:hypothetical protein
MAEMQVLLLTDVTDVRDACEPCPKIDYGVLILWLLLSIVLERCLMVPVFKHVYRKWLQARFTRIRRTLGSWFANRDGQRHLDDLPQDVEGKEKFTDVKSYVQTGMHCTYRRNIDVLRDSYILRPFTQH